MPNYLSKPENIEVIKKNYIGRLGFISSKCPSIVPITYYYDEDDNSIIGFTTEGNKVKSMRENSAVCLMVEEIDSLKHWKTVLVNGTFEELIGVDSKFYLKRFSAGVKHILANEIDRASTFLNDFSNKKYSTQNSIVYKINIWDVTGRYMN